jgi:hypothetical protein
MASGRFTDVPARPTAFLDFRSVTLGESAEFPTRVKGVVAMFVERLSRAPAPSGLRRPARQADGLPQAQPPRMPPVPQSSRCR